MPNLALTEKDKIIQFSTFAFLVTFNVLSTTSFATPLMFLFTVIILVNINFKMDFYKYHLFVMQFCMFCYSSIFWARNGLITLNTSKAILQVIICMFIFYDYYKKFNDIHVLLKIYMWSSYVVVFVTYAYYGPSAFIESMEDARLDSSFANVNYIAMVASTVLVIHTYYVLYEKEPKWQFLLVGIPTLLVISATQSRKALVTFAVGVTLLYIIKYSMKGRGNLIPYIKIFTGLVIAIILVYLLSDTALFSGITHRMEGLIASITGEGEEDSSSYARRFYRQIGWIQFSRTPVLGIGINNAFMLTNIATGKNAYLHCNYAELAADGGSVGLFSYYIIFAYVFFKELKYVRKDTSAIIIIVWIINRLIYDWGAVTYTNKMTYFIIMIYYLHLSYMEKKYPSPKRRKKYLR